MRDYNLGNRRLIIGGVAVVIIVIYIVRLFTLQLMSDDYKKNADSNAFQKKIEYPSRGIITDRGGKLLVYNQPAYDIMVVMNEESGRLDTAEFCNALGIAKDFFIKRMDEIKDRSKNPGYSRFTQQLFMSQLPDKVFSVFREKMFRFPGFYVQKRSVRQYQYPYAAHVLGDVAEVSTSDIEDDDYYQMGDYIGKLGIERSYEKELRGEKGVQILLRDAHGRIQGSYQNGRFDHRPVAGKNLTLSLDIKLQALGERLMKGKIGSIVAIEPSTGEVLCMVSSPTYDPRIMVGHQRGKNHLALARNVWKPLLNRSIMGQYPPGSTFKTSQGLTYMTEGIITPHTMFPCHHGFYYRGLHVGCHGHASPLNLVSAISTSCNAYFCWGLYYMMANRRKYKDVETAMNTWRDYMVSMGFGYKIGIDLPGEKRGLIPNATFYDKAYRGYWNGLTIISIAIGQGEVNLTPLQIANLGATIANRGYYYTPHVVRKVQGEPLDTAFTRRHYTRASRRAYDYIVAGMRSSVVKGTCREANRADYLVCGKTGTAQNRGQDHSVFMGFAPMEKPRIAIAVYVENGGFGADYGVPIGSLMMEQYIKGKLSDVSEKRAAEFQRRRIAYGARNR
ncbi:penicillin-binding protein 2 [Hoylesella enoeca]|uniref:Penicillin-binding protein n=1 Tax=Hoylesella enoeca TaxID=76123 RepID=A0A0S2KI92_9BACT|nr:penicillin-binding protein 2 [Hoylesella enoeca]ALO47961.1 penicillin-binding protein [Hoylesella enoeca]